MEPNKYYPVFKYPIDDIPIDINERIKSYKSGYEMLATLTINSVITIGMFHYRMLMESIKGLSVTSEKYMKTLFFIANTGYSNRDFAPNTEIYELIVHQPNIAITDLDKALLGFIFFLYLKIELYPEETTDINYKEALYTFIWFFHNTQAFEKRTKKTADLSFALDEVFYLGVFININLPGDDTHLLELSEDAYYKLSEIISYRQTINDVIAKTRKTERDYVANGQNKYYWELFLSWFNTRYEDEKDTLELIKSSIAPNEKYVKFEEYLGNYFVLHNEIANTGISTEELLHKIEDRNSTACNYMFVKSDEKRLLYLDHDKVMSIISPSSFNHILIEYHASIIRPTKKNLNILVYSLGAFINGNLNEVDKEAKLLTDYNSIEDYLIYISNVLFDFNESHKETIGLLHYNCIQQDETLYGSSFRNDILNKLNATEINMAKANQNIIDTVFNDKAEDFFKFTSNIIDSNYSDEKIKEYTTYLRGILPYFVDDEKKLLEQEIGNRLIVSINAIYILVKAIDLLLSNNHIDSSRIDEIYRIKQRLTYLEYDLVIKTYVSQDSYCFDSERIDEYRLRKGIDASKIEMGYKEYYEMATYENAKEMIQSLHDIIKEGNPDLNEINKKRDEIRNKINDFPNNATKEFVIELVDQESQFICDTLVSKNSRTDEFVSFKKSICNDIGSLSRRLPQKAIDTLATAEMLYSKYATPEYSNANFDYSCISVLYYQAVETMYNVLFWSKYSNNLNNKTIGNESFAKLYSNKKSHYLIPGYLPTTDPSKYVSQKGDRIHNFLMMGAFNVLLKSLTSNQPTDMRNLRLFFDKNFGYDNVPKNTEEYRIFQHTIDDLSRKIDIAKDRRNDASHGRKKINLEECKNDKAMVLPVISSVRDNYLGLIRLFLSLYRAE